MDCQVLYAVHCSAGHVLEWILAINSSQLVFSLPVWRATSLAWALTSHIKWGSFPQFTTFTFWIPSHITKGESRCVSAHMSWVFGWEKEASLFYHLVLLLSHKVKFSLQSQQRPLHHLNGTWLVHRPNTALCIGVNFIQGAEPMASV